jgi:hypothetical protein
LIALVEGNSATAGRELDSLSTLMPRSDEALGSRYWAGRAWAMSGNIALAESRWRDVIVQQPVSYYATLAARRLKEKTWTPVAESDTTPRFADVDSAFARAALLERLGMDVEARFEYDALEEAAAKSPERLLVTANAFLKHD